MRQLITTWTSWVTLESSELQEFWGCWQVPQKDIPKWALQKLQMSHHSQWQVEEPRCPPSCTAVSNLAAGHNSSFPFLVGGIWAEGWCPETTDQGCNSMGPSCSFCAPTLLFHTNFWKISSDFCSPVFLKMTISRKPGLSITLIWCLWSFCICDWEDAV